MRRKERPFASNAWGVAAYVCAILCLSSHAAGADRRWWREASPSASADSARESAAQRPTWKGEGYAHILPLGVNAPRIDGSPEDECWQRPAAEAGHTRTERGRLTHRVRLCATDAGLAVLLEGTAIKPARLVAKVIRPDDPRMADDDHLTVDLTGPGGAQFRFAINPWGVLSDARAAPTGPGESPRWIASWKSRAKVASVFSDALWRVELLVPWRDIDFDPTVDHRLPLRISRYEVRGSRRSTLDLTTGLGVSIGPVAGVRSFSLQPLGKKGTPKRDGILAIDAINWDKSVAATKLSLELHPLDGGPVEKLSIDLKPTLHGRATHKLGAYGLPRAGLHHVVLSLHGDGRLLSRTRLNAFGNIYPRRAYQQSEAIGALGHDEPWRTALMKWREGDWPASVAALQQGLATLWQNAPAWNDPAPALAPRTLEALDWVALSRNTLRAEEYAAACELSVLADLATGRGQAAGIASHAERATKAYALLLAWQAHPAGNAAASTASGFPIAWGPATAALRARNLITAARGLFLNNHPPGALLTTLSAALESQRAAYEQMVVGSGGAKTSAQLCSIVARNGLRMGCFGEAGTWVRDALPAAGLMLRRRMLSDGLPRDGAPVGDTLTALAALLDCAEVSEYLGLRDAVMWRQLRGRTLPYLNSLAALRMPGGRYPAWGATPPRTRSAYLPQALARLYAGEGPLLAALTGGAGATGLNLKSYPPAGRESRGGQYALRAGADHDALALRIAFAPGQAGGPHDFGAVTVSAWQRPLVISAGHPGTAVDKGVREWLRTGAAQNVLLVDRAAATAPDRPAPGTPMRWPWVSTPYCDYVSASWPAGGGRLASRSVLLLKNDAGPPVAYLFDQVSAAAAVRQKLQLPENVTAQAQGRSALVTWGEERRLRVLSFPPGRKLAIIAGQSQPSLEGWHLDDAGRVRKAPALLWRGQVAEGVPSVLALVPEEGRHVARLLRPEPASGALAILEHGNGWQDTFFTATEATGGEAAADAEEAGTPRLVNAALAVVRRSGGRLRGLALMAGRELRLPGESPIAVTLSPRASVYIHAGEDGGMSAALAPGGTKPFVTLVITLGKGAGKLSAEVTLEAGRRIHFRPF